MKEQIDLASAVVTSLLGGVAIGVIVGTLYQIPDRSTQTTSVIGPGMFAVTGECRVQEIP